MDILFNSLDVRDVFPASESSSSPISAPDLRLLISKLDTHSLRIKSTVQSYLLSHQDDFSSLFSQCSDVISKSENLSSEITELLNLISDQPIESNVAGIIRDIVKKKQELTEKREILDVVGVVLELDQKLSVVGEHIRSGRLLEAAIGLRKLKEITRVIGKEVVEGEPIVYGILRKQWTDHFEEIQDLLLRFMENAVHFELEGNTVHIKYKATVNGVDELELHTILKAMDAADILEYGLAKFADMIFKHVISPIVNRKVVPLFITETDKNLGHVPDAMLKLVPCDTPEAKRTKVDGETMYANLVQIIEFINKFLCFQNGSWMRCLGRLTWPRMSDQIILNFLSMVVPDDPSKLIEFQEIMVMTTGFESSLKHLMFISPFDIKDEKLSKFADNIEVHFALRKKVQILAKARNILLQANFSLAQGNLKGMSGLNKDIASDVSNHVVLLFSSEKCVVSEAAKQIMELVHETLENVCLLPPKMALEFYHSARNSLVLYEAIVPVKLERKLESINQTAVLIHNDCLYLSQEILGLAFEYLPYFPSSVKEGAVFVDLAPRFQIMAEEVLQRHILLVMHNLKQAIDGADGFQNTHQIKQFESAKFAIDQVSFIIEKVHIIWEPLMLPSIYEKSMTMILKAVFSMVAKEILLLDDMAAEETLQLQRLIHLLFEHLSSLLEPLLTVDQSGKSLESQSTSFDDFVQSARKLRKLAELLDMPLKSITGAWESGELTDCGFTVAEVEDLIRAIFTDSSLRRECLARIETSSIHA